MGLLNDAIREHLELKRRHGADASEVSKLEQEAFGPVRRSEALEVSDAPRAPGAEAVSAPPHDDELSLPEPPHEDELSLPEPAAEAVVEVEVEPEVEPESLIAAAPRSPEPEPAAAEPQAPMGRRADEPGQETAAFSLADLEAEEARTTGEPVADPALEREPERTREPEPAEPAADVVPADEEPGEDDVLEETPEFLQETPEHDRLWFEQKPPRDFDF